MDNKTLTNVINEFENSAELKKFILKICFNFLYYILPQNMFYDLNSATYNSINLLRNIIFNRITFGNANIPVLISTDVDIAQYKNEYNITTSNNACDKFGNRYIELQLNFCNYLKIKISTGIRTFSNRFAYTFIFDKDTKNVSILDWSNGLASKYSSTIKRKIQNELATALVSS